VDLPRRPQQGIANIRTKFRSLVNLGYTPVRYVFTRRSRSRIGDLPAMLDGSAILVD
jgi:hypothetical protein